MVLLRAAALRHPEGGGPLTSRGRRPFDIPRAAALRHPEGGGLQHPEYIRRSSTARQGYTNTFYYVMFTMSALKGVNINICNMDGFTLVFQGRSAVSPRRHVLSRRCLLRATQGHKDNHDDVRSTSSRRRRDSPRSRRRKVRIAPRHGPPP